MYHLQETVQNSSKQICWWWVLIYSKKTTENRLKNNRGQLKMPKWCIFSLQTPSILLHKTVIDRLEVCGLLEVTVCFNHLFEVSFWRHPFTAEDKLVSEWCNITVNVSKSVPMKKQTHLQTTNLYLWANYSFNEICGFQLVLLPSYKVTDVFVSEYNRVWCAALLHK